MNEAPFNASLSSKSTRNEMIAFADVFPDDLLCVCANFVLSSLADFPIFG